MPAPDPDARDASDDRDASDVPDAQDAQDASDWSDLDLLTVSEATERLDREIDAVRREITEIRETTALAGASAPDEAVRAALAAVRHRLTLLDRARERARTPTAKVETGRVRTRAEVEATPGPPD